MDWRSGKAVEGEEFWKYREETISRKHLAEPNAKSSSGVKPGEANGLSNQKFFSGRLKKAYCLVFMCWERSESVRLCWENEPIEKQIKNT